MYDHKRTLPFVGIIFLSQKVCWASFRIFFSIFVNEIYFPYQKGLLENTKNFHLSYKYHKYEVKTILAILKTSFRRKNILSRKEGSFRSTNPYYRINPTSYHIHRCASGEPGLVDRVLALHAGSRGFDSHRGHVSERFFLSNRPRYPHPVSSELENSGIRVAVGDCSVTERRRWRPPYQTGNTVHVHTKHYKHNEDGRTAPGVFGNGSVPLSHTGNVVTRMGTHTHPSLRRCLYVPLVPGNVKNQ